MTIFFSEIWNFISTTNFYNLEYKQTYFSDGSIMFCLLNENVSVNVPLCNDGQIATIPIF